MKQDPLSLEGARATPFADERPACGSLRIVVASHTADLGGAELALVELTAALVGEGVEVHVVLPGTGPLTAKLVAAGAATWTVAYDSWATVDGRLSGAVGRLAAQPAALYRMAALLSRLRPDVVITNTLTIPIAAIAARILRIPHVWSIHEFGAKDHGFSFDLGFRNTMRLIRWLSRRVMVNSHALLEEFARWIPREKVKVIYGAVEVEEAVQPRLEPVAGETFRVVLVGQYTPAKGHEDAIRAVGLLRQRGRDVHLTLVGHGRREYVDRLRALIREVRVDDGVHMADFTPPRPSPTSSSRTSP